MSNLSQSELETERIHNHAKGSRADKLQGGLETDLNTSRAAYLDVQAGSRVDKKQSWSVVEYITARSRRPNLK